MARKRKRKVKRSKRSNSRVHVRAYHVKAHTRKKRTF